MIIKQAESLQNQSGSSTPLAEDTPNKNTVNSDNSRLGSPTSPEHPSSSVEILLKKLEFMVSPGMGYILQFLSQGSHYDNFAVKKHMLQLLCKIFELKGNPFVRKKSYVDAYVSYFYIRFIKLYQNYVLDPPTLELCQLYLRLLLSFSMCKVVGMRWLLLIFISYAYTANRTHCDEVLSIEDNGFPGARNLSGIRS